MSPSKLSEMTDDYYWEEDRPTASDEPSYIYLLTVGVCIVILLIMSIVVWVL